jgi:FKBP-type peptidyl-prolyl cis-trans isomerase FkpA
MQLKNILYAAGIMVLMAGCNNVNFKKTKGGMPYKLFTSGKGPKIQNGEIMKFHFTQKLNDSVLATSYSQGPRYIPVDGRSVPYDVSEVIMDLRKGDSLYAVQMVDTFIKQNPNGIPPQFKKGMKIITTIKVLDIFKNQDEARADETKEKELAFKNNTKLQDQLKKDIAAIQAHLSANNIQAQKTKNGAFVQIITQGNGPAAVKGKFVSLKYKGTNMAGKVFDTNMDTSFKHTDPLTFVVGTGQMITGFDEGVQLLKKGDKARIYIPSSLAFGPKPSSPNLGPDENVIFDVEVLDVEDQVMPPGQGGNPAGSQSPH